MSQFEFHVSRQARLKYQFEEGLFALNGNVVLADFGAARRFAEAMTRAGNRIVPASDINAMGLIDEILHILVRQYALQNPGVMAAAVEALSGAPLETTLLRFNQDFPPLRVHRGEISARAHLDGETAGIPHRQSTLEEMLMLHLSNLNPAFHPYRELFDDRDLQRDTAYGRIVAGLKEFFAAQPTMGSGSETLFDLLAAPARIAPHSLTAQLEFLLQRWGGLLGEGFVQRLLRAIDFAREESLRGGFTGGFAGEAPVQTYAGQPEYERFSQDKDWMPRCILMAKNTYVWLEQLSRKHGFWVKTLNLIPDQELDLLAERGFTGLWLIGLWERSRASRRIKQRMGDQDAVASAYSLDAYDIAADLGGWDALDNLRGRAWQRGIRLSADMVPNHMGIDSRWVVEHPDRFLSLPQPPYPTYAFQSEDLSDDERVGIFLEDHYYSRSDAAVVFKRIDRWTGDVRYIYHGNDGTSMPWNDTAQLDYSRGEVREAVIQTILHVARNFPVIRFDAAMTLAKKHIQRLWFPEPGAGGAIPSRSEHGLTRAQFEAAVPNEFWREVVDRVAAEVPDTLLLAEAFWMMEGYFVRTLGMHRVYNSAFMHMLRDEDNAKYRTLMKNTLAFDPQVLKRFVNFLNNPDEKTAIDQFGDGDKYFGVCTLMATLPGLPMFGHGQVEGFREKYGMEFRAPKWDEQPNEGLVSGHAWRIFPLLHRRRVFAEVENFLLYDFFTPEGHVNEDVFAHSNRHAEERGLVIYHNKYAETSGWIKRSAAYLDKGAGQLVQKDLAEGLALPDDGYAIFKDYVTQLEYLRPCRELVEKGLFVILGGYQCHAFLDWRFTTDDGGRWTEVYRALNESGIPSVQAKYDELFAVRGKAKKKQEPGSGKGGQPGKKKPTGKGETAKATGRKKTASKKAAQ
ncbi:MAG: alpha-amylase [Anaerolineales bacterium]|nr:alpha-amylase [Anaerolineales bacterium]